MKAFANLLLLLPIGISALAAPHAKSTATNAYSSPSSSTNVTHLHLHKPELFNSTHASPITCGGLTSPHGPCPANQICFCASDKNTDFPGVCIGQPCGGRTPGSRYCPNDQVCVRPVHGNNQTADVPGHCVMKSQVCGGIGGSKCREGWSCVADPSARCKMSDPDCQGVCEPNQWSAKTITTLQKRSTSSYQAKPTSTPTVTFSPVVRPEPIKCASLSFGKCPKGQFCSYPRFPDLDPDHVMQCVGQPCGGFVPHPQYCPQKQVCVRPISDNDATKALPGKCVPKMWACVPGLENTSHGCYNGWTCMRDPENECEFGKGGCQGVCQPDDWVSWTEPEK